MKGFSLWHLTLPLPLRGFLIRRDSVESYLKLETIHHSLHKSHQSQMHPGLRPFFNTRIYVHKLNRQSFCLRSSLVTDRRAHMVNENQIPHYFAKGSVSGQVVWWGLRMHLSATCTNWPWRGSLEIEGKHTRDAFMRGIIFLFHPVNGGGDDDVSLSLHGKGARALLLQTDGRGNCVCQYFTSSSFRTQSKSRSCGRFFLAGESQ